LHQLPARRLRRGEIGTNLAPCPTPKPSPTAELAFDHPFFIILNLAVGGSWPGYPDETTMFPQFIFVDYVRVYQKP
jgi:beta-glucanase (GH16 family)